MKKKHNKDSSAGDLAGFDNLPDSSDFYAGGPKEAPLYTRRSHGGVNQIRKTDRHQATGRPKEIVDVRERMALLSILKTLVLLLLLIIAFFMLWKGIKIYEESVWLESQADVEVSPVLNEVIIDDNFDVGDDKFREQFAERIGLWKETERLVSASKVLTKRNNYDLAIERCQDALRLDPAHLGALNQLGHLYYVKGLYVEAVNSYIRLVSIDPTREDLQKSLIQALEAIEDHDAVRYMAEWYHDQHVYDVEIQRYLANALFAQGNYEEAAKSFARVLQEAPGDVSALELQAASYMEIKEYTKALIPLKKLRVLNYHNLDYYRQIAICHAQLEQGYQTIQILGRATQIFGDKPIMSFLTDTRLDPVRDDRNFQAFIEHVGGEGFRKWLDKMADSIESADKDASEVTTLLELPEQEEGSSDDLLKKPVMAPE